MEWCQGDEVVERGQHVPVDHDRRPERRPSVHDPVPGGVDGPERVERVIEGTVVDTPVVGVEVDRGRDRVVVLDHAQLQA